MKVLYLGFAVNKNLEKENPAISVAGNRFQLGFLSALKGHCELDVKTQIVKPGWPGSKEIFEKRFCEELMEGLEFETLPYINIRLLKELTVMVSVAKSIIRFCKRNREEKCIVISYNGNGPFSIPILALRKLFHYRYICLVVDPPLYQGTTKRTGLFYKFLYNAMAKSFHKAAKKCDDCVVLNAYYAEEYLHRKDYFVLDCGVSISMRESVTAEQPISIKTYWDPCSTKKHIVFTGTLHEHSGILRFIEMFREIGNEYFDLHIWGKGIYEDEVRKIASETDSIFYHGYLPNDEIRQIQEKADFLLCPNTIEHPINKVAFPSKIQEYMLSGIPVIATKVNGLGEDYHEHLYLYDDTISGLEVLLKEISNSNEQAWKLKGEDAKEFIISQKNWNKQVEKMLDYLKHEQ